MANERFIVGVHRDTKVITPIHKVSNRGLACNCICSECEEALQAVFPRKRKKYFRHDKSSTCSPSTETQLHLLAKEIIRDNSTIYFPDKGMVEYSEPECEIKCDDLIPDATVKIRGIETYIEIVVTNPIDADKFQKYKGKNSPVLVINLHEEDRDTEYEALQELVLRDTTNKEILEYDNEFKYAHEYKSYTQSSTSENTNEIAWIVGITAALGLVCICRDFLFERKR